MQTTVRRIRNASGLQPHRSQTFRPSGDPAFADKVRDTVGPYLSPPDGAVVLRVDGKSRIRAPDRTQPVPPLRPGIPERRTRDYKRNGTTPPFAASGFIIGKCHRRHRPKEFPDLLKEIGARIPKGPDVHIVMDNTPPTRPPPSGHGRRGGIIGTVHFTPTPASRINQVERRFA